jgi:hypothetical protein
MELAIVRILDAISRIISCTLWLSILLAQRCYPIVDENFVAGVCNDRTSREEPQILGEKNGFSQFLLSLLNRWND